MLFTLYFFTVSDGKQEEKSLCKKLLLCAFQEPAPMTEDLLEEQSKVLAKLGTSAEGAHLRARMQSACLLSDMESFKVGSSFESYGLVYEITNRLA